ncbi:hypothetical protein F5146DRAFT_1006766 [Armillaria mellea]|nr:hypothetical protein F5146DRAFT_1006766 [Armillaria mellea]
MECLRRWLMVAMSRAVGCGQVTGGAWREWLKWGGDQSMLETSQAWAVLRNLVGVPLQGCITRYLPVQWNTGRGSDCGGKGETHGVTRHHMASTKLILVVIYWILRKKRMSFHFGPSSQGYHFARIGLNCKVTSVTPGHLLVCHIHPQRLFLYGTLMSIDTKYSFEEISKDPKVLLQNANLGQLLKGWDRHLGAALDSQVLLVTPNVSLLFQPPMGMT